VPSLTSSGLMASEGQIAAMAISPDGNWLYTIEFPSLNGVNWILQQYQLTPSTGVMKLSTSFNIPFLTPSNCSVMPSSSGVLPTTQLCSVAVAPSGGYVIVASGNGGAITYPYSSSGGASNKTSQLLPAYNAASADLSVTVDSLNTAYIGQTDTLSTYSLTSSGTTSNTTGNRYTSTTTPAAGAKPRGVTLNTKGEFVYTANQSANTISQYSTTNGVLTSLGSTPAGPASVSALGVDNTGAYLVAAGYNSTTGIQLSSITAGVISNLVQNAGTGTDFQYPTLIAMTH
jgi:6-phosphogluconolactonase